MAWSLVRHETSEDYAQRQTRRCSDRGRTYASQAYHRTIILFLYSVTRDERQTAQSRIISSELVAVLKDSGFWGCSAVCTDQTLQRLCKKHSRR